jgi:MFS family permease
MISGMGEIFRNRNFRLLWSGEAVSLVGDQFYMVALPWLVLTLTGNAFAIGTVLALVAIPRAVFMLVGGALTDRLSPRTIMLCSNISRLFLVAALAGLTLTGSIELWMLYTFAILFGLADAFFFPAQSAMIPRLLGSERLQTGNAVIQGTAQLSVFLGPVLAGTLIALLDGRSAAGTTPGLFGIGIAFGLDAISFLVSASTLGMISVPGTRPEKEAGVAASVDRREEQEGGKETGEGGLFSAIRAGLTVVWRDRTLRYYFVLIAMVNLLMTGPISVGIPVLAQTRFAAGAAAFGIILSAFGGGSLVGVIVAGTRKRPAARRFPMLMLGLTGSMGFGLALLGLLTSLVPTVAVAALMGLGQGYVVIQFITWLQLRTEPHMLGRMMSVLLFAVVGLSPLSSTVAGALIQWSAEWVLVGAGMLMVVIVGVAALSPSVWRLGGEEAGRTGAAISTLRPETVAASLEPAEVAA